jgi:hypothetical protein
MAQAELPGVKAGDAPGASSARWKLTSSQASASASRARSSWLFRAWPDLWAAKRGQQGMAGEVEVADGVEDLVLDELVGVAQAIAVEHPVFVHHDGVFQAAAQGQALVAQGFDILHETEGAGAGDFLQVGLVGEIDRAREADRSTAG